METRQIAVNSESDAVNKVMRQIATVAPSFNTEATRKEVAEAIGVAFKHYGNAKQIPVVISTGNDAPTSTVGSRSEMAATVRTAQKSAASTSRKGQKYDTKCNRWRFVSNGRFVPQS